MASEYNNYLWSKTYDHDERIKCFQTLAEIKKKLKSTEEEYLNVSMVEGRAHKNAWKRIEIFTAEYKKEYERCKEIIKY
jgi:hypothetical protein